MPTFDESVFVNCPFDKDFEPILQAILFCIVWCGLTPRLSKETDNAAEPRLDKIASLIKQSKYSIHDLSRCQAKAAGEYQRMNMPFELGLDFGCRKFGRKPASTKSILVLEENQHSYDIGLSDLSGSDVRAHDGNYATAIRKVRNWFVTQEIADVGAASKIVGAYEDFLEWYYEKQEALGYSKEDILDYSTIELLRSMKEWIELGKPI